MTLLPWLKVISLQILSIVVPATSRVLVFDNARDGLISPYPGVFSSPSWAKSSSAMILEYCLSFCSIGYLCYFHLSFLFLSLLTVDEHSQMAGWEGKQIPHLFLSHPPSKYESQSASEYQENESNTIHNICLTAATGRNISISLGAFRQGNHPIAGCKKFVVYQKALL